MSLVASFRLLVPPPVRVEWRSCTQVLAVERNPHRPFGKIVLQSDGQRIFEEHFDSGAHAEHVLANGWMVVVPSRAETFLRKLVSEGRAEVVAGTHAPFCPRPRHPVVPVRESVGLDARYSFKGERGSNGRLA